MEFSIPSHTPPGLISYTLNGRALTRNEHRRLQRISQVPEEHTTTIAAIRSATSQRPSKEILAWSQDHAQQESQRWEGRFETSPA